MKTIFNKIDLDKPTQLSNPIEEYIQADLDILVNKEVTALNGVDFRIIFNVNLPSGCYDEIKYFLPISYKYLTSSAIDQCEMIMEWVDFIFCYEDKIYSDFKINGMDIFSHLLTELTATYQEVMLNEQECKAKGWGITSYHYVENSGLLCEIMECISHYNRNYLLILLDNLLNGSCNQKKWLYELYEKSDIVNQFLDDEIMLEVLEKLDGN